MKYAIVGGEIVNAAGNITGTIVVENGRIKSIDRRSNMDEQIPYVDARNYFILPGFVDLNGDNRNRVNDSIHAGITTSVFSRSEVDDTFTSVIDYALREEMSIEELTVHKAQQLLSLGIHHWIVNIHENDNIWNCDWKKIHSIIIGKSVLIWLKLVPEGTVRKNANRLLVDSMLTISHLPELYKHVDHVAFVRKAIELSAEHNLEIGISDVIDLRALKMIKKAQKRRIPIKVHVSLPYLLYSNHLYQSEQGVEFLCLPPLRTERERRCLVELVYDGTITCLSGYSTAMDKEDRERLLFTLPPRLGVNVQDSFISLYSMKESPRISLNQIVKLASRNPARLLGCFPQKGIIASGSDADLLLLHKEEETIDYTFVRGKCLKMNDSLALHTENGRHLTLSECKRFIVN